jgi:hypothetical protein
MDLLTRAWVLAVCAASCFACTRKAPQAIAGLHSAARPLYLLLGGEKRPLAVGSHLRSDAHVVADGPAMLEFFAGGAVRFMAQGDEVEVGEALEARMLAPNLPAVLIKGTRVLEVPLSKRPIPVRYTNTNFTPPEWLTSDPSTGDYLKAFFTPHGIERLGQKSHEGPRTLPPAPPLRPHLPHIHAGDLGSGGPIADISGGSAAAETDDFATALLLDGSSYDLGRSDRLFLPKGVTVAVHWADATVVTVEGPAEIHLH